MKRKIAAILAADAVGYSRLVAEDEEDALARLASYRAVFTDFITRFGGRIFNTAGDAVLAEFQSAVDAVRCGVDLQETLRARNQAYPPSRQMSFRIGITIGDVVERNGDLLGDGVNIAARLESMAPPGGICISRTVYEAVANKLSVKFSDLGRKQLKNIPDPVHAYTIALDRPAHVQPAFSPMAVVSKLHWGVYAVAFIVAASLAGFLLHRMQLSGGSGDDAAQATNSSLTIAPTVTASTKSAKDKSDNLAGPELAIVKPPPLPTTDPVVRESLIIRQWKNCLEGTEAKPTVAACQAVIDYKISTGSQLALVYQKLGRAQRADEAPEEALRAYSEAISLAPSAEVYNDRGIAYFDKRQWKNALDDYTEAIRLDPKFGEAYNNRAWTRFTAGEASQALADANKAVELLPGKAYAWDTRGHVHEALKDRTAAIRDFRKALELDPKSDGSRLALQRLGVSP